MATSERVRVAAVAPDGLSPSGRRPAAVITGASSGVGRALALTWAAQVEHVALIGRDRARLEGVADEVRAHGASADCFAVDLQSQAAVRELGRELGHSLASISLLVHSAGVFSDKAVDALSPDEFERTLAINLRAPFLLTRELLGPLRSCPGDVVFINSSVVGQRRAGLAAYGASKHGLVALADSLRQEVNPLGIRVLSVFLGATATPMQEQIYSSNARPYDASALLQPDEVAHAVCSALALGRGAEVTDLHIRAAAPHRPA